MERNILSVAAVVIMAVFVTGINGFQSRLMPAAYEAVYYQTNTLVSVREGAGNQFSVIGSKQKSQLPTV